MRLRIARVGEPCLRDASGWTGRGRPPRVNEMLVDEFLPVYDVSDTVATMVDADASTTWAALMDVDLVDVGRRHPLSAALGTIRILPDVVSGLLRGQAPPPAPRQLRLRDLATLSPEEGGWILLAERDRDEIAFGLVGKFWLPVIAYAKVTPLAFESFNEPGYAKTVYSLSVQPLGERQTLLSAVMRTATTDEHARRWFRRYWTFGVGSGAHVLVNGLLDVVRDLAERQQETLCP
jgi:hypothetical protein